MLNSFLSNSGIPKLTFNEARICDGKLTVGECYKSLQLFESNKSPGNNGFTVEFYRAFWHILGNLMVDSLNNIVLMISASCQIPKSKLLSL